LLSNIAKELALRYEPVAIVLSDDKPSDALHFKEDTWGCVVAMYSAAARGRVAAFDNSTVGCGGGAIGLGLATEFDGPPGGIEHFLSSGKGEGFPPGERYIKTPELAGEFVQDLPCALVPTRYVIFKPLSMIDSDGDKPAIVSFLANPDQISALVVLANYGRQGSDNVTIPFGAGCHHIFLLPYAESMKEIPRAVVGLTDITARSAVDPDLLSFSVPWKMFEEMEANVEGSFLERPDWKKIRQRVESS